MSFVLKLSFRRAVGSLLLGVCAVSSPIHAATRTAAPPFDLADGSFEQGALTSSSAPSGFVYGPHPPAPLFGSGWVFNLATALATSGSASSVPTIDGNQSAFLQGADWSRIAQTVNIPAGRYVVQFVASQKQDAGNLQKIFFSRNGQDLVGAEPPATGWTMYTSPPFELANGSNLLEFHGDPANSAGYIGFVDRVRLLPGNLLENGGFELPALPASMNNFEYAGNFTPVVWAFDGGTGIARSNSAFNNGVAPEGNQVALIQSVGPAISQAFTVTNAGRYRLSFKARQRIPPTPAPPQQQTLRVTIDTVEIGTITPSGSDYATYLFDAIKLSAGAHTLSFIGADANTPAGHAAFVDDVSLVSVVANARRWSDTATWGGTLPTDQDKVIVPAGSVVLIDGTATARELVVDGEVHCADENITLTVESITVTGRFVCGSLATPYEHDFEITLKTPTLGFTYDMGEKSFGVMQPGVVELHGKAKVSWTQLSETAAANTSTLKLASAVDWVQGDKIVIAPTNGPTFAVPPNADSLAVPEVREIHTVSGDGKTITLVSSLQHAHYGLQSTHTSTGAVPNTWTLDERAEVGLLSRNITIKGDDGSVASRIGGHMMTMQGTSIHASGIELYRMGQHGQKGRYPFHWHLVGHAPGQYIRNSSVHDSYHRCITVHGTHDTLVADNVCYNFSGHGFFLEDGIERNNVFDRNLGIQGKKPGIGAALATDNRTATASNGPATFWISHPSNIVTRNVAAGFEGSGFWYHTENKVTGDSAPPPGDSNANGLNDYCESKPESEKCINPKIAPFGIFADNRAHSGVQGFSSCENESGREGLDSANVLISNFTANNVLQGVWPCAANMVAMNSTFENLIVANAPNGMQSPSPVTIRDSIFIARTANEHPHAALSAETPFGGIYIYDQGFLLENVHFENYDRPLATAFYSFGGAHKWTSNRSQGLSFTTGTNVFSELLSETEWYPQSQSWSDVIHDIDGTLTGTGYALVADRPLTWDATCRRRATDKTFGYGCPYHYAQVTLKTSNPYVNSPEPVTVVRSDGAMLGGPGPIPDAFVSAFIADGGYRHAYRYDRGITRTNVWLSVHNANPGESTIHEILDVPADFRLDPHMPSLSEWQEHIGTMGAFLSGPGRRYHYREDRGSLLIKTEPEGSSWFANDYFWVCLDGNSNPAADCNFGARSFVPPAVAITSPDRVASSASVAFAATVTPSASLKLFVDDVAGNAIIDGVALPHSASLPDGRYLVRVIAYPTANETYSALQTLIVGEPEPRIAISSLVNNGTYLAGSLPTLSYQVLGTNGSPQHVHWLVNGVDQGEASMGPVSLAALEQGRNDVQLAFANTDHSLSPVGDRRTIFVAAGGMLADFEDGLDPRTTFTPHGINAQPVTMGYQFGRRATGRVDAGEDGQLMTTTYVDASATVSRFRLTLQPAQNWTSYAQIKTYHTGPAYEVFLIYSNGSEVSLGFGDAGSNEFDYFDMTGKQKDKIVAIEMRQTQPASSGCTPSPCTLAQVLYYVQLLP